MNHNLLSFLQTYFLKKGEVLELTHLDTETNSIKDIPIIKRLSTRIKQVGVLTCSLDSFSDGAPERVDHLQHFPITPRKKIDQSDYSESDILEWLSEGWIVKEIRFMKDGRSVDTIHYRMGYRLYRLQQALQIQTQKNLENEIDDWKNRLVSIVETSSVSDFSINSKPLLKLYEFISIQLSKENAVLLESTFLTEKWVLNKKLMFLHFLAALLQLSLKKSEFDWKEIGAHYYQEIGGSKKFDSYKDDFLTQLEEIIECPASNIGLVSLGKITPLFFSGLISGSYSEYKYGPVHALTDLAIAQEDYTSSAKILWLVENRAILTRFSAEKNFLKEYEILMVCVDGHLRSSHRQCLLQLTKNSHFTQVLIWTDYDKDGIYIAAELYEVISKYHKNVVKWVTHDQNVLTSWREYEESTKHFKVNDGVEQEQILGGSEDWKKWIQLQ
ncbi:DUF2399 domain-containing protein [Neobacillus cucumis]|uniref:Toprim sub domain-containing protein n=1 Tax=Neobacillus cucumis TaxID=1740721 RepID=A0A2N5HAA3_9BACI|nr:DUF2399 domain-containing protein [Neobacillus cucumis]PLS02452.1 Toprim sub domain-containing protein [Neobacillus cucumis]